VTARAVVARRPVPAGATVAVASALAVLTVGACTSSSTQTAYTPYEGIDVPSSLATAGVGCGLDSGIAYYAAILTRAADPDAGAVSCTPFPDLNVVPLTAASFVACFTASAVFELDAGGPQDPQDVWVLGYAGGAPSNVPCTDPTCPLVIDSVRTLFGDQANPATRATITLKCRAVPELSQHPQAFGCIPCPPGAGSSVDGAAAAPDGATDSSSTD
jgi:hypothetical protein